MLLSILIFLFLFSLYIFYIYFYKNPTLFFGKVNKWLYICSSIMCIILLIPFIYNTQTINIRTFIDLFIMILSFIFWMISIYYKNILFRNLFIIIILIVNIDLIYNNKNTIGFIYLFLHHFFIDFILWNIVNKIY